MFRTLLTRTAAALTLAATCTPAIAAEPVFHRRQGSQVPFSHSVQVGDVIYLSGMIGISPDGTVPADVTTQTHNAMSYIKQVLALSGNTMDDVFKCTVAMQDIGKWDEFNKVFLTYFKPDRLPAQTAIGVSKLVYGSAFEIDCLAAARTKK